MKHLWFVFTMIWHDQQKPLLRGILLSVLVLLAGAGLLALSGWFIVAAGVAGLAGIGAGFDFFTPSAGVRTFALGRTAARYGERVLTHDATLRALASLRVRLLDGFAHVPYEAMIRLRGAQILTRLTADVDALDGISLRLAIPAIAAFWVLGLAFVTLWLLAGLGLALWVTISLLLGVVVALVIVLRRGLRASRLAERAAQAFRIRTIDLLRGQEPLVLAGQLPEARAAALEADRRMRAAEIEVAATRRRAGLALSLAATLATAGALLIGLELARAGRLEPALAALAFFMPLSLAETILPFQRGLADLGRMADAARRVAGKLTSQRPDATEPEPVALPTDHPTLEVRSVPLRTSPDRAANIKTASFTARPGMTVGLSGPSGVGKSTLLAQIAGLAPPPAGAILLAGCPVQDWPEPALRAALGFLPQRSVLMSGPIRDTLHLARPDASDDLCWQVLCCAALDQVIAGLGGLGAQLGESGRGLSGGEMRRLALARVLIRRPKVLLLDEPTEGLDDKTALSVLRRIRDWLPDTTILIASHRHAEEIFCDHLVKLG